MQKKIIYIVMLCMLMALPLASAKENTNDPAWVPLAFGNFTEDEYYFNKDTIRYGRLADGDPNYNIVIYEEKHVIMSPSAVQYKFYDITQGKINIENEAIQLGRQDFFTRQGKLRWTDTPQYMVWLTVKPDTYGYLRYEQLVKYATEHKAELVAHTMEQK